ncbi:MAG: SDR family NAD(P)-dependent oxidoreductase [Planctomycetota bacterium]
MEGRVSSQPPKIAFLFTGQGELYPGICTALYECHATFRATIDLCDQVVRQSFGWSLVDILKSSKSNGTHSATEYAQPLLFAIQVSLAQMWQEWGVRPSALLGHSVGEMAAACVSGVFSIEDGIRLVATRGRLMQELPSGGGMVAILKNVAEVDKYLIDHSKDLVIAGINAPNNTVVAGNKESLATLTKELQRDGMDVIPLRVTHAFHSPLMEPILSRLTAFAETIEHKPPTIPLVSNLTGSWHDMNCPPRPEYWAMHARHCVRFADGANELLHHGHDLLLEIGPGSTLTRLAEACASNIYPKLNLTSLSSLEPGRDEWRTILSRLGTLFVHGVGLDWEKYFLHQTHRRLPMPTTPYQRRRFWIPPPSPVNDAKSIKSMGVEPSFHEVAWKVTSPAAERSTSDFLDVIFRSPTTPPAPIFAAIRENARTVIIVEPGEKYSTVAGKQVTLRPTHSCDFSAFLSELAHRSNVSIRLHFFWTGDDAGQYAGVKSEWNIPLCHLLAALMTGNGSRFELWVHTRAAESPEGSAPRNISSAAAWGIVRCARLEAPHLRLFLRDLVDVDEPFSRRVREDLHDGAAPLEGVYSHGKLLVPQMRLVESLPSGQVTSRVREGGVYILTGGLGSLGLEIAQCLASQANIKLVLISRTPHRADTDVEDWREEIVRPLSSSSLARIIERLRAQGSEVIVRAVDIGDRPAVRTLVAELHERFGTVNGVVHTAGVLRDHLLVNVADSDFADVFHGKVDGARILAEELETDSLDFFVTFSSLSAHVGNIGQSTYAAANMALEAFTSNLAEASNGTVTTLAWGPWSGRGMADNDLSRERIRNAHIDAIEPAAGRAAFLKALAARPGAWIIYSDGPDRERTFDRNKDPFPLAIFHDKRPPTANKTERAPRRTMDVASTADMERLVRSVVATVIQSADYVLDSDRPFSELGVDSVLAEEIARRLSDELALPLSASHLYQHPSIRALAQSLVRETNPSAARATEAWPMAIPNSIGKTVNRDVAIVGYACRFPDANNPDDFWRILAEERCVVGPLSNRRWKRMTGGKTDWLVQFHGGPPVGGFLADIAGFDPWFFRISPTEATSMDPRQRLFLEVGYHAAEHAGYGGTRLRGSRTGVYVGSGTSDYLATLSPDSIQEHSATGGTSSLTASRLAYFLDLKGPCLPVDTACSSGLVAVHLAMQGLRAGECDFAFAGAVHLYVRPTPLVALEQMGALAPDHRCRTFDKSASGFVPAEGVAVLLLRPLADAMEAGDRIYGVLRGSAVNNDGRSNGVTAPNLAAQSDVLLRAWHDAGIEPRSLDYIEAHGTGTRLGDPIEVQAIADAFRQYSGENAHEQTCGIGSLKTNFGHADATAGIAGILKVLLSFRHDSIPASLFFQEPNPRIAFETSPLTVIDHAMSWPRGNRLAGVSAFGFSGTNAHVVLAEPPITAETNAAATNDVHLFVLSANSPGPLQRLVNNYLVNADTWTDDKLDDISYTMLVGRMHGKFRLAFTASSTAEVKSKLKASARSLESNSHWENGTHFHKTCR